MGQLTDIEHEHNVKLDLDDLNQIMNGGYTKQIKLAEDHYLSVAVKREALTEWKEEANL